MDSIERTTLIRDDDGDSVTVKHDSRGGMIISTDAGQSVRLDEDAVNALVEAVTACTPGATR